jgi:hypothetical protein
MTSLSYLPPVDTIEFENGRRPMSPKDRERRELDLEYIEHVRERNREVMEKIPAKLAEYRRSIEQLKKARDDLRKAGYLK